MSSGRPSCWRASERATHYLVGEDENVVLLGNGSKLLELCPGEHLADRVVGGVEDDDFGLGGDGGPGEGDMSVVDNPRSPSKNPTPLSSPQLVEVDGPVLALGLLTRGKLGRVEGHVDGLATVEDDRREVLVEEGLDADDLVLGLEEREERGEHA